MEPLSGKEIRRRWIAFFEEKGHLYVPGVPLVPQGDKSLLFVNAGVTGLKKYFDGSEVPPCRRIVNVQKSIRTNDIENVGHTARHHTFFEMLGNFSIGDYFRKEVIPWAMEILTDKEKGFGMPIDKLYATYNPDDHESYELWQKAGMDKSHLVPLEGNYWEIGEGPSGPNTEVFFDRGEKYDPDHLGIKLLQEDISNDRYIEIWGIVFSQYNAKAGVARKDYEELPSKNIDTGAGLERIACILQGTETNFETDLFMPIIKEAEKLSGVPYKEAPQCYRVIADHVRCLAFALSDGARFSNEGRGYVLRRIIRRAMRYGRKIGINGTFMYKLLPVVTENFGEFYPNLKDSLLADSALVLEEEKKFLKTLEEGEAMLSKILAKTNHLSGNDMFRLYDTYGFPSDLSKEIALENGATYDEEGFLALMEEQKERARNARGEISSFGNQSADLLAFKEPSLFLYQKDSCHSKLTGLFKDGKAVSVLEEGEVGEAAFEETPFYAEMGGQTSDTGVIEGKSFKAEVSAVLKAPSGQHLHRLEVVSGEMKVGDEAELHIDGKRRRLVERNHSATHLLHAALGEVLGRSTQEGSFVGPDYLRFDYNSPRKPSKDDIRKIEQIVNEKIAEAIASSTVVMPLKDAIASGAEAEFGEKYGDEVRVVGFGDFSRELCGGTHVSNTSDIGIFVISSDEAVSSGVRRIEARTSLGAYSYLRSRSDILDAAESSFYSGDADFLGKIASEKEKEESLEDEVKKLREKIGNLEAEELSSGAEKINGISFLSLMMKGKDRNALSLLLDSYKSKNPDCFVFLAGGSEGHYDLLMASNGKALEKLGAGVAMKEVAPILGGSGGGKPAFAGGSAKDLSRFEEAVALLRSKLQ